LSAVTGVPERHRDVVAIGVGEMRAHGFHEAQRRGFAKGDARAALDEPSGGIPLAKGNGVLQRRAAGDDRPRRVDVRASVEHSDVVTAGRPVQRSLHDLAAAAGVDIGACGGERPHHLGPVREVARPVRGHVQQRAGVLTAHIGDLRDGELRVASQKLPHPRDVAAADRVRRLDRERIVVADNRSAVTGRARRSS
jgi:hypothetical protein